MSEEGASSTHAVGKDHDAACREDLGRPWMCKDAFEDGRIELNNALRKVVEALQLVRLGSRFEFLERLELALALNGYARSTIDSLRKVQRRTSVTFF
jgi:hypothetical protein